MKDITLEQLLEAGCHFGHKSERWHPKASQFIYTEKDGIHIIDLAKTRDGLLAACDFVRKTVASGGDIAFVATKRQAKGVVREAAISCEAPFFTERWIGGYLTNWDEIKKNVAKANRMQEEKDTGAWKKFPKHEQVKLGHHLDRLHMFYEGVLTIKTPPKALFIVDVRKEISSVREAIRCNLPVIAIVDTNSNPDGINYVIPANDDAVGSVELIVKAIAEAYAEGRKMRQDEQAKETPQEAKKEDKKNNETKHETEKKTEKKEKAPEKPKKEKTEEIISKKETKKSKKE